MFEKRGAGLGLRHQHHDDFLASPASVDWVEVISENFMAWRTHSPPKPVTFLEKVRAQVPVALHGVSLSLGSADEPDLFYLKSLKDLVDRIQPWAVSDHLCWTGVHGANLHDLMPLPQTPDVIPWIVEKILKVQEFLGRRILIENVSSYLRFQADALPEWEFLSEVAKQADCGILLDVNNVYVNSVNHGFDPLVYLRALPRERVGQIHLAGHDRRGPVLVDTHARPVCSEVWALYAESMRHFGPVSAMIERDSDLPSFDELRAEVELLRARQNGLTDAVSREASL